MLIRSIYFIVNLYTGCCCCANYYYYSTTESDSINIPLDKPLQASAIYNHNNNIVAAKTTARKYSPRTL